MPLQKPYSIPESLDNLKGPTSGTVELPIHVYWQPGPNVISIDTEPGVDIVYQAVIAEGRVEDVKKFLNRDVLVKAWSRLNIPAKAAKLWHEQFPDELIGNKRESWPV